MTHARRRGGVHPISVAPMMDRTDRHFRFLMRCISRRALLYTEMVVAQAIRHGDRDHLLGYDPVEHPIALQLGGDDPELLAECARMAEDRGYDEVNLNVGCPSERVQSGNFGVCLMGAPDVVARCVSAMKRVVSIPVTVKHRIGFDDRDQYEDMRDFVTTVAQAGADRFTVHARKAWLKGLSPKENRNVPPLRYDAVHRLKRELPHLEIEINGGLRSVAEYAAQLDHVDAVMVGRAAWDDPFHFVEVDPMFYGTPAPARTRDEVVEAMLPYLAREVARGTKASRIAKPMLNLYAGIPGGRRWRRILTTRMLRDDPLQVLQDARAAVAEVRGAA